MYGVDDGAYLPADLCPTAAAGLVSGPHAARVPFGTLTDGIGELRGSLAGGPFRR